MFNNLKSRLILISFLIFSLAIGFYSYRDKLSWKNELPVMASCPNGYTSVSDFCVAQYEMRKTKNDKPQSIKNGKIWHSITRTDAIKACKGLGPQYNLINNSQWQMIAWEIEENPFNWSSGIVGDGCLHNGKFSGLNCNYKTNDFYFFNKPYIPFAQKLASNEKIYDFSNNYSEFVSNPGSLVDFGSDTWAEIVSDQTHPAKLRLDPEGKEGTAKFHFGPKNTYLFNDKFKGTMGKLQIKNSGRTIIRGGTFLNEKKMGVFSTQILPFPDYNSGETSFRCVYQP